MLPAVAASTPSEQGKLLEVVRDPIDARLRADRAQALTRALDAHRAAIAGDRLLRGVDPARPIKRRVA